MGTFGFIFDVGHAAGPIPTGFLIARLGYNSNLAGCHSSVDRQCGCSLKRAVTSGWNSLSVA